MDGQDVAIVGAGAVGLCIAFELGRRGARVLVLDRGLPGRGCSFGNAGLIVPSHCMPFASSETLRGAPGWLFDRRSPVRLGLRMGRPQWRWLRWFFSASRGASVTRRARALRALATASLDLFATHAKEGLSFGFRRSGWLHVYRHERAFEHGSKLAHGLEAFGVRAERLDPDEVRRMEPALCPGTAGGWFYPEDAQIDPFAFVLEMAAAAQRHGVSIKQGEEVTGFHLQHGRLIAVETTAGQHAADHFVVAAGAESSSILGSLVGDLPILPGRGSSYTLPASESPIQRPLQLVEARVVVSPLVGRLRLTTGLDLGDDRPGAVNRHLDWLRESADRYLDLRLEGDMEPWGGLRPMSPDGLPLVGPLTAWPNLHLATGHGQLGMSLAPVTGQIAASLITGEGHPLADALSPARFGI